MPLSNLNNEQLNAAKCEQGYNLIIASAGTGKTSTIVGRIAHLLNIGVKPEEILLLTFTNKAASEMITRISSFFSKELAKRIMAGTFHSVSYKLLEQLKIKIILKQTNELKTLFKSLYEKRVFYDRDDKTNPYDGSYLYDLYSLYLNSNNDEEFGEWILEKNSSHNLYTMIYEDVILEFNELKEQYSYVNFDDLLLNMLKALETNTFNFKEILVDEYQDTNSLQGKLLNKFNAKALFCVGDYDQSIYAFNGSDINIISSFSKRYQNAQVFTLTKNYRSTKSILDLATKVISHNERIYDKKLELIRNTSDIKPKLLAFNESFSQYEHISKLISQSTNSHDEIAVIYRNNSSADGIEANLREYEIPSKRKGGMSFFDSIEVRFVIDILLMQISNNDMMAFIHILEHGKGIGKAISKDIFDALIKLGKGNIFEGFFNPDINIKNPYESNKIKNIQLGLFDDFLELGSVSKFKNCSFSEAFLGNPILKHPKLNIDGAKYIYDFYLLLKHLKKTKNPLTLVTNICSSMMYSKLKDSLTTKRASLKDGSIDTMLKTKSLAKINRKSFILKNIAKKYTRLDKFINSMILGASEMAQGEGVNLLSIHASKGLEFKEVYIIDLMQGRFPNNKLISKGGSLEEERRLFYVAVTRAKDILYLSFARYDKIKKMNYVPSVFLKEASLIKSDD